MIELPNRHGTAGQDSHPKGVLAAVPSHVPDNGRDMSETLIVPKALSRQRWDTVRDMSPAVKLRPRANDLIGIATRRDHGRGWP